jgi:hypothetical protein
VARRVTATMGVSFPREVLAARRQPGITYVPGA